MKPWHGYLALSLAVIACIAGYARNGNEWCVFVAGVVAAFGLGVWQGRSK